MFKLYYLMKGLFSTQEVEKSFNQAIFICYCIRRRQQTIQNLIVLSYHSSSPKNCNKAAVS